MICLHAGVVCTTCSIAAPAAIVLHDAAMFEPCLLAVHAPACFAGDGIVRDSTSGTTTPAGVMQLSCTPGVCAPWCASTWPQLTGLQAHGAAALGGARMEQQQQQQQQQQQLWRRQGAAGVPAQCPSDSQHRAPAIAGCRSRSCQSACLRRFAVLTFPGTRGFSARPAPRTAICQPRAPQPPARRQSQRRHVTRARGTWQRKIQPAPALWPILPLQQQRRSLGGSRRELRLNGPGNRRQAPPEPPFGSHHR